MKTNPVLVPTFFLALILAGATNTPAQAQTSVPDQATMVCLGTTTCSHAPAQPLLAYWYDWFLNSRGRVMQVAFMGILLGIFMLRWGGK